MPTTARTLLCAVPQPVEDAREIRRRRNNRRSLRFVLGLSLVMGMQALSSGPAAVATLPSALTAKLEARAVEPVVSASLAFTPELGKDPDLFRAILEGAFSITQSLKRNPAPEERAVQEAAPAELEENLDEIIPFNGRNIPRWLVHAVLKAAQVTGVDPVYMMTLADVESSLSPQAKAPTSSAQGLFQFIDRTWLEVVHLHAADYGFKAAAEAVRFVGDDPVVKDEDRAWIMNLRTDAYFSALMAGELIKDVERALHAQGERELAEAELYLAHFLGANSAVKFLEVLDENPNMRASALFPKAAKANAGLFMEGKGNKRRPVSVAELYNKIDSKIVRRMDRYEDIGPYISEVVRSAERTAENAAAAVQ